MAIETLAEVILEVGKIALWFQAIGIIVILWVIFEIISLIVNRKKRKAIYSIKGDLARIEKKIDKLLNKK